MVQTRGPSEEEDHPDDEGGLHYLNTAFCWNYRASGESIAKIFGHLAGKSRISLNALEHSSPSPPYGWLRSLLECTPQLTHHARQLLRVLLHRLTVLASEQRGNLSELVLIGQVPVFL